MSTTAVVLCGGRSLRFGSDKTRALLAGRPLLDHVLDALPADWPIVTVGPARTTSREVTWVREQPAFGGPLAGLAAGLSQVDTAMFALLGGDMPQVGDTPAAMIRRLLGEPDDVDAVVAQSPDGRLQPLLSAARTELSRTSLPRDPVDASLMSWIRKLRWRAHDIGERPAYDIDTPTDLMGPAGTA